MATPEMIAMLGRAVKALQATAERMTQNQAAWMTHQAQAAAQAQPVPGATGRTTASGGSDAFKRYSRVEKLASADEWREWHYQFTVATKARDAETGLLLEKVELMVLTGPRTQDIMHARPDRAGPRERDGGRALQRPPCGPRVRRTRSSGGLTT